MIKLIIFDWGRTLYDNDNNRLFPETKHVLETLSNTYQLAIVSLSKDGDFERRWKIFREHDLEKYFISIQFTQHDKDKLYEKTLSELKTNPKQTVVVDDRMIRGISWGNRNKAKTIWIKKGKFSKELPTPETGKPTYTIEHIAEILNLDF